MEEPVADPEGAPAVSPSRSGIAHALSWMIMTQVVSQVAWFGSLVVLGILLPPNAFGAVAAGMVIVSVAMLLMGAGTYGDIVTTRRTTAAQLRRGVLLNVGIGVALSAAAATFAGPVARSFAKGANPAVLQGLLGSVVAYSVAIVPLALLVKHMQMKRYALVNIGATAGASAAALLAALAGAEVWALVARQVVLQTLVAAGAWWAVRDLLPQRRASSTATGSTDEPTASAPRRGGWFFLLAVVQFVAFNTDYLVVGRFSGVTQLGLYSLAFGLAFAPLRQLVHHLGAVFFSASAAEDDPERVRVQMLQALRMSALVFLPLLPPVIVAVPVIVPAVLGERWRGMVPPFQVLLVAGIGHAMLNIIGEFLLGTGHVGFRARVSGLWAAATVILMCLLVPAAGILGAALTHALLLVPLACAYAVGGGKRLGLSPDRLARALRPVVVVVVVQTMATAAVWAALGQLSVRPAIQCALAAGLGLGLALLLLDRDPTSPLAEARQTVGRGLKQRRAAAP